MEEIDTTHVRAQVFSRKEKIFWAAGDSRGGERLGTSVTKP